jgi:hypothetical protein
MQLEQDRFAANGHQKHVACKGQVPDYLPAIDQRRSGWTGDESRNSHYSTPV